MAEELNSKERVLKLFKKEPIDRTPVFSGMGNVTVHGLEKYGWQFSDIHLDAHKMASMAATTFEMFGFESAVVPFDMGVEAEALGAGVNYYAGKEGVIFPTIVKKVADKVEDLQFEVPSDLAKAGRIPLVVEAIRLLKKEMGDKVAIGAWALGPQLILGQICDIGEVAKAMFKKPELIDGLLDKTAKMVIELSRIYREAGADYFTVRECGSSTDILSPALFKKLVRPHLEQVFSAIESPKVLHICGNTDMIVEEMAGSGPDAISVEERNHVAESRKKLGRDMLIFGNVAGYTVLVGGKPEDVDAAVKDSIANGVDAIWPGCDIWPTAPKENMQALVAATKKYGKRG
jgi:MtaA/CmuA family methyltransferase